MKAKSVFLKYPNGYIGTVSADVAKILCQRPGHMIVREQPAKQAPAPLVITRDKDEVNA